MVHALLNTLVCGSLEPSRPNFFRLYSKNAVPLFLPASEKKLGRLGTRLSVWFAHTHPEHTSVWFAHTHPEHTSVWFAHTHPTIVSGSSLY